MLELGLGAALDCTRVMFPLRAEQLVYEVRGRRLVDGLSLTVDGGSLQVILGPNGAGKSLSLRLLHGLLRPTGGRVLWAGREADSGVRRRQAMVFQRPVLLRRSAAANIRYALGLRPLPREMRRQRLDELLALAGLESLAHQPARKLSGGEQQRLALARALALSPEILFLDEPTASLDPASTLAIEALIRQAHGGGTTVVLVTHDLGQARRLAEQVVFLHRGRVAESAPAGRFFEAPASPEAQAFLAGRIVV